MIFTRIALFLAWAGLILGGLRLAQGISMLSSENPEAFVQRYGSVNLDVALCIVAISVALGVLAEISRAINKRDS